MEPSVSAQQAAAARQADLAAVSVSSRIPDFWEDKPTHWFIQIDAILNPQHLSDQAKYDLVIAKLSKEAIGQITDLLLQPPSSGKYETIKKRLLYIYEESATRQLQKLLSEMDLGDQKPSQLLRRMRDLAREKVPDHTLCILWQNHLPPATRAVLAVAETKNLEALAATADTVMEATRPIQVAEVSKVEPDNKVLAEIAKISTRLASLEERRINQPSCRCGSRSRDVSRDRGFRRRRSVSRGRGTARTPNSPDWLCSYHYRYKEKAHRCVAPCAWKKTSEN